ALREESAYRVLTIAGAALMFVQFRDTADWGLLWFTPRWLQWVLLGVEIAGLTFTWWARLHLGTLWSARVTRKDDHRIVDSGPYGIVRHPIYTGLIVALIATVLAFAGPINIAGCAILIVSFVLKARLEERFLKQELGAEAYESYQRRVPMLVPFWPMGGR
ncbi:MAG TPA: isoprenylcysteine carboxylmethyltransferase family protein, partial [Devosia sp.]|nr:isoprenylcysteine carboxylmethyltransferase family protein [Devosia sp.]